MARNVFIVSASQVITSEAHPEGLYSTVSGFPKVYDGEEADALKAAKAAYYAQLSTNYGNSNPNRVMMTVTLERADGRQYIAESIGGFPEVTPPEPEPEEPEENPAE